MCSLFNVNGEISTRMEPLSVLRQVVARLAPGRSPSYTEAHVLKAMALMEARGGIGRQQLARELRLGEGIIRTLVARMKRLELLDTSRGGMSLTIVGQDVMLGLNELLKASEIPVTPLTVGQRNHAILVKGAAGAVRNGLEQRDAALIAGAKGATTLIHEGGQLLLPGIEDPLDPTIIDYIKEAMSPSDGDAVIIGSSDDAYTAEIGAISAALKLLDEMVQA